MSFRTLALLAAACGGAGLVTVANAQDAMRGGALYADLCAMCHGPAARGDGPMADVLSVAVPDLTALSGADGFPTLAVAMQIDGRTETLAHGGPMPVYGPFFEGQGADIALPGRGGQPVLMAAPVADLVAYLQEIQQ